MASIIRKHSDTTITASSTGVSSVQTPASPRTREITYLTRSLLADIGKGLYESTLARRVLVATVLTGVAVSIAVLCALNPAMIAIIASSVFIVAIAAQALSKKGNQMSSFELVMPFKVQDFNDLSKILETETGEKQGSLHLGALPNRLHGGGEYLAHDRKIDAVLSINEPWERAPKGLSLPYSREDWETLGVEYTAFDVQDHHYPTMEQLHDAADTIDAWLKEGKNVYVHCRAGNGRSAMMIAAYLIKYRQTTAAEAVQYIKAKRSSSSILKKLKDQAKSGALEHGLKAFEVAYKRDEFEKELRSLGISSPLTSPVTTPTISSPSVQSPLSAEQELHENWVAANGFGPGSPEKLTHTPPKLGEFVLKYPIFQE